MSERVKLVAQIAGAFVVACRADAGEVSPHHLREAVEVAVQLVDQVEAALSLKLE